MQIPIDLPVVCPIIIGRTTELTALHVLLERAKSGKGQVVLLSGEAGIGKSRLVAEAKADATAQDFLLLQGQCFLADRSCPYAPLLDLLRLHFATTPPDHIAISQFTTAAIVKAANPNPLDSSDLAPHCVSKLYYMVETQQLFKAYQSVFGELVMHIDGMERRSVAWPTWAITTRIDTQTYRRTVWEAILCHESQLSVYRQLEHVSKEDQEELWDSQTYYRVFSLVNGGRRVEEDLFEGLR